MNWIIRLGTWWQSRRVLRKPDYDAIIKISHEAYTEQFQDVANEFVRVDKNQRDIEERTVEIKKAIGSIAIELSENKVTQTILKEIMLLKARLDQLELYVGLKREPKPEHIPGSAKIS